ncbi:MAG: hypothetical protein ACKV19_13625 [Verrucomicrobiales bacterium]
MSVPRPLPRDLKRQEHRRPPSHPQGAAEPSALARGSQEVPPFVRWDAIGLEREAEQVGHDLGGGVNEQGEDDGQPTPEDA